MNHDKVKELPRETLLFCSPAISKHNEKWITVGLIWKRWLHYGDPLGTEVIIFKRLESLVKGSESHSFYPTTQIVVMKGGLYYNYIRPKHWSMER